MGSPRWVTWLALCAMTAVASAQPDPEPVPPSDPPAEPPPAEPPPAEPPPPTPPTPPPNMPPPGIVVSTPIADAYPREVVLRPLVLPGGAFEGSAALGITTIEADEQFEI